MENKEYNNLDNKSDLFIGIVKELDNFYILKECSVLWVKTQKILRKYFDKNLINCKSCQRCCCKRCSESDINQTKGYFKLFDFVMFKVRRAKIPTTKTDFRSKKGCKLAGDKRSAVCVLHLNSSCVNKDFDYFSLITGLWKEILRKINNLEINYLGHRFWQDLVNIRTYLGILEKKWGDLK